MAIEKISNEISENAKKGEAYAAQTVNNAFSVAKSISAAIYGESTLVWNRYTERWEAQVVRPGIKHLIRVMR